MHPFSLEHYDALRHHAGVIDRSSRGRIAVSGRDRLSYLHAMLTNDIAALVPGRGCYSAYLTPQGRMIADMRVFELGDLALIDLDRSVKDEVLGRLEQYVFSEDVQFADLSGSLSDIAVFGPRSPEPLAAALAGDSSGSELHVELGRLPEFACVRVGFDGGSVIIAGNGDLGVRGFDLFVDPDRAAEILDRLLKAGVARVDESAADVLRIEAGRPRFGVDMDTDTIPLEAGIEQRAISFTKGCYPGQEIITRVVHRGHGRVARKLVGIVIDGNVVPLAGDLIEVEGKESGKITSGTYSPALSSTIALGYVRRDVGAAGTALSVLHEGERVAAHVVDLPFVSGAGA